MSALGFPQLPECDCSFIVPMDDRPCVGDSLEVMFYNISALNVAITKYIKSDAGQIKMHASFLESLPSTELVCNGASYSVNDYPQLFAKIGYQHGRSGEDFHVPDYRGLFLRGVDFGSGNDPSASARTASRAGANSGDKVGSFQDQSFQRHHHSGEVNLTTTRVSNFPGSPHETTVAKFGTGNITIGVNGVSEDPDCTPLRASCETRPKNKSVIYTITTGICGVF